MQNSRPHIALLASAGVGHLIPVVELGKQLITHHNFHVTVFVVSTKNSLFRSPYPNLTIVTLPLIDISTLVDPDDDIVTKIVVLMRESLPNLRSMISDMKFRPTVLIVDMFGTDAFPIADEFNMLKYVFYTSNAWALALLVYAPIMEKMVKEEHVNQKKPLQLPGCRPIRFEDMFEVYQKMNDRVYSEYTRMAIQMPMADGILINTWEDIQRTTIESLNDPKKIGKLVKVPVHPIGPLARPVEHLVGKEKNVIEWLDSQPIESVIYVSFGSGGTLSTQQTIELAWGLELSQQRFIWVFRPPVNDDSSGSFFTLDSESEALKTHLPDGFLTRTQEVGLVIPMWAPQSEILAHSSIGGFLTHCGWNSTIESITNGVPMIVWPLYAEQRLNATLLVEELKIAIRSEKQPTESTIGREEIAMMVRKIMKNGEGESIRKRVKELKNSGEKALSKGGSAYNSLTEVAKECEYGFHCIAAKARGA